MGTFKRTPFEIDTSVKNGSKYLNQMQFNGIVQNNNTYDVDQNSLTDALNVYVNDQNTLVSREPLVNDSIEIDYPTASAQLIDIKECNGVKVFVFKNSESYIITAYKDGTSVTLTGLSNYYLTIFNQYIICWNNNGAKVIDTNNEFTWKPVSDFADIPITKIITGIDVETRDYNRFTTKYKEQYIVKEDLRTILPKDKTPSEVVALSDSHNFTINNFNLPNQLSEYRTYRLCNYTEEYPAAMNDDDVSYHNETICIQLSDSFMLSRDYGQSFIKISYPDEIATVRWSATLSEDGRNVFVIVDNGVWRCDLSDYSWSLINIRNDSSLTLRILDTNGTTSYTNDIINAKFVNAEVFMFIQTVPSESGKYSRLYF